MTVVITEHLPSREENLGLGGGPQEAREAISARPARCSISPAGSEVVLAARQQRRSVGWQRREPCMAYGVGEADLVGRETG